MERYGVGGTNVGLVRDNNEDSIWVRNETIGRLNNLYIVADGMGGHNAGEVASAAAIASFCAHIKGNTSGKTEPTMLLAEAAQFANEEVYKMSVEDETRNGMGTTLSACSFEAGKLVFAHIGDSRIYVYAGGVLTQITNDHTYAEELVRRGEITPEAAQDNPWQHMLTRALGTELDVAVDVGSVALQSGDMVLLCSDGLTNMVTDQVIAETLRDAALAGNTKDVPETLIQLALQNGGADNISVILL